MKRPQTKTPRRPRSMTGAVARNRKEAAMQMVRLEFEVSRLELSLAQAEERAATHKRELGDLEKRRGRLLAALQP